MKHTEEYFVIALLSCPEEASNPFLDAKYMHFPEWTVQWTASLEKATKFITYGQCRNAMLSLNIKDTWKSTTILRVRKEVSIYVGGEVE